LNLTSQRNFPALRTKPCPCSNSLKAETGMPTGTSTTTSAGSELAGVLIKWSISPTSHAEARTRTRSRIQKRLKRLLLGLLEASSIISLFLGHNRQANPKSETNSKSEFSNVPNKTLKPV
jgi:hypothetical protein